MSQVLPPGFGDWSGDSKYELRGTLGAGAMGVVLDGFDRAIERRVAIKLVRKPAPDDAEAVEAAARFKREAQAAGRLSHPGIVAVYDYGENDDTAWIVMERVDGGTLKAVLDRNERLPVRETGRIMGQVLNALAYAHARGVIHRDIKPANVMLTSEGDAKLADFGIARLENSAMTQVGTLMGTPSYMAPEQLRGEALDARADIWAAGVMLYQLLTGEKPFPGGFSAVMHKVLNTEPVPPSALSATSPPALDAVVMKALAKRPDDRWPDARAFAAAIEAAIAAPAAAPVQATVPAEDATLVSTAMPRPTAPPPAPATPSRPAPSSGRRWVLPAAGIGAVAIGAAAFLLWPPEATPPTAAPPAPILSAQSPPASLPSPAPSLLVETPGARQQSAPQASSGNTPAPTPEPFDATPSPAAVPTPPPAPAAVSAAVSIPQSAPATVATEPLPAGAGPVLAPAPQPPAPRPPGVPAEQVPPVRPVPIPAPALQVDPAPPAPTQQTAQAPSTQPPAPQTPPAATTTLAPPATQLALAPLPRPDWRAIAASAVATAPCGLLSSQVEDAGFRLQGVLPRREAEALRRDLAGRNLPAGAARLDLSTFDAPLCPLVAALRPALAAPGDAPEIALDGAMPLRKGQLLRFSVRMPAWANHLHVAYATLGGPVARLEPGAPQAPGARIRLGDPRPGFQGWEIDEPYGTDLLLVVASEGPLFAPGAAVVEEQDAYAKGFAAALQAARAAGRRVAMRPLVVDTIER